MFEKIIRKSSLSVATANNKIQRFDQNSYIWLSTTPGTFLRNVCQTICSEMERTFPIISLGKLSVAIATKAHYQLQ